MVKMKRSSSKSPLPVNTPKIEDFLNIKYKMLKKFNLLYLCTIKHTHIFKNKNKSHKNLIKLVKNKIKSQIKINYQR